MMSRRSVVIVMTSFFWFTATAAAKEMGLVRSLWVVRGGRAELPCAPTPKHKQDSALVVLWYRSSDTIPVYSYDAREGEFTSGVRWADEGELGGRAHFIPSSEPPTLVLEPAHARDQGVYTCRVDYLLSPSTTAVVNLTVVVPPGPPMILWGGRGVVDVVGPLGEGERAELTCRSKDGRPPPTLTWTRRGQRLPLLAYNTSSSPIKGYNAQARVAIVGSRDLLGSTLSCHAHMPSLAQVHTTLPQVQTASVIVNVTLPPVTVRILGPGAAASAGTKLRLTCRAAGSHPPAQLTWWSGHKPLSQVSYAVEAGGNVTSATLTLLVDREHNGATLTCTAANPALPGERNLSDSIRLSVYYAPVVDLSMGRPLDPRSLKEGDDVYFECSIIANPPYKRVIWYHNGAVVGHNVSSGVVVSRQSLILRHLNREHSGSYTCGATNHEGHNTSNAVILSVKHAPVCAGTGRERTQGAPRGSTASIKCTVEAEPAENIRWSWIRKRTDGTEEEVPDEDVRVDGLSSSVLVTPHTPEDYGRFLCVASNDVGEQREACVVTLVPAGPPDAPTNCSVSPADPSTVHAHPTSAALTITCLEGFDGGLPQHFTLETWQDNELIDNMTSMFPEWVVSGLRAGVGVTLRVAAHNSRGRSDALRFEVHTASAQHHAAPDSKWGFLGVPPLLGAIVGVGGVLLIILVTGLIVAKYTWRPQPPTHVHTLIMTPTTATPDPDTYDPDVVSSLRRPADSLDVLPRSDPAQQIAAPTTLTTAQASMHHGEQGQTSARTQSTKHGSKHTSFSRGFCLHRQNSPFGDSEETGDSDSDSTFTDLTAAGRAAAALPPGARHCNSLPRARKQIHQLSSSPLDLQLRACQVSQVVATPDGMIQRIPYLVRNPRQPPQSSSGELRHLTASAEELHPLIFSRDFTQLLSSADVRHLSYSGTELRLIPGTGTWPLASSSGELRLPLQSSGTLHSITTEEFRLLPSSSGSSPWDSQTTPIFNRLSPASQQMPYPEKTQHSPQIPVTESQSQSPCAELQPRSLATQPLLQAICTEPQTQSYCQELKLQQSFPETHNQGSNSMSLHLPSCPEVHAKAKRDETYSQTDFVDPHLRTDSSNTQSISCMRQTSSNPGKNKTTTDEPMDPTEPQVSLRELQPPSAPSGDVEPLLSTIELQPPPSFREPEQCSQFQTGSLLNAEHQRQPIILPVTCPLSPPSSQSQQYKAREAIETQFDFKMSHVKDSPSVGVNEIFEQSEDTFFPTIIKHDPVMFSGNQFPERYIESSPEGGSRGLLARKGSKKGKQVTFSGEEDMAVPVVSRVPPKTVSGKSDKRCAQLFSCMDLPPSGRTPKPHDTATPSPPTQQQLIGLPSQETADVYPHTSGTPTEALHKIINQQSEITTPSRTCRGHNQFSSTPGGDFRQSFMTSDLPHTLRKTSDLQSTHTSSVQPTLPASRLRETVTPECHESSQQQGHGPS
ncbi:uncharacterized protein LOC123518261 isoform X2 [Portunus trituberculatus]|uniref:uncharacterized protein LOC123518261 isoform X2 n=2 Tax=Portunus trituberculatus TaxID=210409 RepID=UPI001E1D1BD3|nr:uncharacterized protein LOC123518261 isoform X2 [Portunus trituberculatus]